MLDNILERVNRVFNDHTFTTIDQKIIKASDVLFFFVRKNKTMAFTTEEKEYEILEKFSHLEKQLNPFFLRCHRFYLANFDRITGISRFYPVINIELQPKFRTFLTSDSFRLHDSLLNDEPFYMGETGDFQLRFSDTSRGTPISRTYIRHVKKKLGISSFEHLVPDNPEARKLRELGLVDFGFRELRKLDKSNPESVEAFKEKFDIKRFSKEKMLNHFRMTTIYEINKIAVIRNVIWQYYRWIIEGIEKKADGNIRSLWYKIKAVLAYHSNIFEPNDVDTFYNVLSDMIEKNRLFKYRDFGFSDMNKPYRGIGEKSPEIILASEKNGHFFFIKKLAEIIGCTYICLKGEPSHISMEYFSHELHKTMGKKKKPLRLFIVTDVDPAGASIARNFRQELEKQLHEVSCDCSLVNLNTFDDEEIEFFRYPVVRYEKIDDVLIPMKPSSKSNLTKAMRWFFSKINDERLFKKEEVDNREVYTIFGLESDAASRDIIRGKFLKEVKGRYRKKT